MQPRITILSVIRYFLFFIVFNIIVGLLNYLFVNLFEWGFDKFSIWVSSTSWIWIILLIGFVLSLLGLVWGLFKMLSVFILYLNSLISPLKAWNLYTVIVLSCLNFLYLLYAIWSTPNDFTGWIIFEAIIFSFYAFEFSYTLITGSVTSLEDS